MSIPDLINVMILGAILGAMGQAIRIIVGLKKVVDLASAPTTLDFKESFEANKLIISLLIGAVAGAIGLYSLVGDKADCNNAPLIYSETYYAVIAMGYSGADFIEGFMRKAMPTAFKDTPPAPAPDTQNTPQTT
jgi:hypothetical protein